jgi:hypothetical protein
MQSFLRWMRVVLPPPWAIGVAAGVTSIAYVISRWLQYLIFKGFDAPLTEQEWAGIRLHQFSLAFTALLYGMWRVTGFHPFFRPRYRDWLRTVAWDPSKPLPLGPPKLDAQDGVVLLVLASLTGSWEWGLICAVVMLAGWSAWLTAANYGAGLDGLALLGALSLLPLMLIKFFPWLAVMSLPAYLIAAAGVAPSLRLFPWEEMPRWDALRGSSRSEQESQPSDAWPLVRLPHVGDVLIAMSLKHALMLATFVGAAIASFMLGIELDAATRGGTYERSFWGAMLAVRIASAILCFGRILTYAGLCRPPINVAGRLATGRWIVPGYDQIFVAPLLTLLIGFAGPALFWHWRASAPLAAGSLMFAIVAITLGMGPALATWHLTGHHRIVVRRLNAKRAAAARP